MQETLKDYFCSGEWDAVMRDISALLGGSFCYLVMDYNVKLRALNSQNPVCLRVRDSAEGSRRCLKDYEAHLAACRDLDHEALFRCHMGLHRLIIPLSLPDGTQVFFIMCGFKTRSTLPPPLMRHAASLGLRPPEFRRLHAALPPSSEKQILGFGRLLRHMLGSILELLYLKEQLKNLLMRKGEVPSVDRT